MQRKGRRLAAGAAGGRDAAMNRVWLNGRFLDPTRPMIAADDRGFLLADGVFETIRVHEGMPLRLTRHLARLQHGASLLGLGVPPSAALGRAISQTLAANRVREGSARLTVTRGRGARGIDIPDPARPTVLITTSRHAPSLAPLRVLVHPRYRRDERSPLSGAKALGYLPAVLARRDARARGADDALLLNVSNRLASATAATLLVWYGRRWVTPPCGEGALLGTARAVLLEAGLATESPVTRARLATAPAALLVNALGARPVRAIDGHALRWPRPAAGSLVAIAELLELPISPSAA